LAFVSALVAGAWQGARADLVINGDWVITGSEAYADQTITVNNTTMADGNVTVTATGTLSLENVTLLLPSQRIFNISGRVEVRNSTLDGPSWFLWIHNNSLFEHSKIINATYFDSWTHGATLVETRDAIFDDVNWSAAGGNGLVQMAQPVSVRNSVFGVNCYLLYALPVLSQDTRVEITNNRFAGNSGDGSIHIMAAAHTGSVTYDIDRNSINGGYRGIVFDGPSLNTRIFIHDGFLGGFGGAAIIGQSFDGSLALANLNIDGAFRGIVLDGSGTSSPVGTVDNVTLNGTSSGITAGAATLIVRDSDIRSPAPQYVAEFNGRILIYDTNDLAFASNTPSFGGSIEHFMFLNMEAPTWQGGVTITGGNVTLLNSTDGPSFYIDPASWIPSEIVWWGMYDVGDNIDNRVLRAAVFDAGRVFNCTPGPFFVGPGMPFIQVVCDDNAGPAISVAAPASNVFLNFSRISGQGSALDYGAGLLDLSWSLDNATFAALPLPIDSSGSFSFSATGVADGVYTLYFRAHDRVGHGAFASQGPVTIDTVAPVITLEEVPAFVAGPSVVLIGVTEPFTTVTVLRTGGWNVSTVTPANGSFAIQVPLDEGQNTYTLRARDRAGNLFETSAVTGVDTIPPVLAVQLNGQSITRALTRTPGLRITGATEPGASVKVNGQSAAMVGGSFTYDLALLRGDTLVVVEARDRAANVAMWVGSVLFDDDDPVLQVIVGLAAPAADGVYWTRDATVALNGSVTDPTAPNVTLQVNGRSSEVEPSGDFHVAYALLEGENVLTIVASDPVGNHASQTLRIRRDTTAPSAVASLEGPGGELAAEAGVFLTRDGTLTLIIDATENGSASVNGDASLVTAGSNRIPLALHEGRNGISVLVWDNAGNPAPPISLAILLDTTAPTIALTTEPAGPTVQAETVRVVGSSEPFSTVRVNGIAVLVSPAGEFAATVPLTLGPNTIRVEAVDALGNGNSTELSLTRAPAAPPPAETPSSVWVAVGLAAGIVAGVAATFVALRGRKAQQAAAPEAAAAPEPEALGERPRGPKPR
jgi:hypothetical protein